MTDLKLWSERSAEAWMTEALPIGRGRLGTMMLGGVERERIPFNEISLWTGSEDPNDFGAYQAMGNLIKEFAHYGAPENYRRELDLVNATSGVRYTVDGVCYSRELFASYPDQAIVGRFSAVGPVLTPLDSTGR